MEPEKGRSAILAAARQVVALHALNGRWPDVTLNAGVIAGGTRPNVVPAECRLQVDLRAATAETFDAARAEVERLVMDGPVEGVTCQVRELASHRPMEKTPATARLAALAIDIAGELGFDADRRRNRRRQRRQHHRGTRGAHPGRARPHRR